jgi:hypothetical protein
MSQASDLWYVRLPDGQIVRANSTEAVRHHLQTGRIPRDSWVRRSHDEEWVAVEWVGELADAAPPPHPAAEPEARPPSLPEVTEPPSAQPRASHGTRQDRMQLQPVGARGMFEEMLKAVDSTLVRIKLRVACLAGLAAMLLLTLARLFPLDASWPLSLLPWCGVGLGILIAVAFSTALITQTTFVELSTARAATWPDSSRGLGRNAGRLVWAYLIAVGLPALVLLGIHVSAGRLATDLATDWAASTREALAGSLLILELLVLVLLGPLLAFAQLLGPILVIEECSAGAGLRQWRHFVRQHFGRLFFYEAFAITVGVVATLPLLIPTMLAAQAAGVSAATGGWDIALALVLAVVEGVALTPLLAYLAVANVFIYLSLRYELGPRR